MDGQVTKFAQLYIYDTEHEVQNRMQPFSSSRKESVIDSDIVSGLVNMFDEFNVILKAFRMARDRFTEADFLPVRLRLIGD